MLFITPAEPSCASQQGTTTLLATRRWRSAPRAGALVVLGANDPSFISAGGAAFMKDVPKAEIHLLEAGHFALDEKTDDIAGLILDFMDKHQE